MNKATKNHVLLLNQGLLATITYHPRTAVEPIPEDVAPLSGGVQQAVEALQEAGYDAAAADADTAHWAQTIWNERKEALRASA